MNISGIALFFLKRKWILAALLIVTLAGFLSKQYSGPAHRWFNNYGAGLLYEVFWCLAIFFFTPNKKHITPIAISVFTVTCILETLQLFKPPFLQMLRSTFLGKVLLGTTFVWWDFPHYVLGCILGWLCMQALSKRFDMGQPLKFAGRKNRKSPHFR